MSRLTLVSMTVVLMLAGSAFANDGTQLIYDLTELGHKTPVSTGSELFEGHGTPEPGTPPRAWRSRHSDLSIEWSAGDLELKHRRNRSRPQPGSTVHNSLPPDDNDQPFEATPNPEPGTLLLMGSGVAAGARFLRRRKNSKQ
jgi:hypothetical protein